MSRTNFDRIKDMSVEEMTSFIGTIDHYSDGISGKIIIENHEMNDCFYDIMEWLEMEVEE